MLCVHAIFSVFFFRINRMLFHKHRNDRRFGFRHNYHNLKIKNINQYIFTTKKKLSYWFLSTVETHLHTYFLKQNFSFFFIFILNSLIKSKLHIILIQYVKYAFKIKMNFIMLLYKNKELNSMQNKKIL